MGRQMVTAKVRHVDDPEVIEAVTGGR